MTMRVGGFVFLSSTLQIGGWSPTQYYIYNIYIYILGGWNHQLVPSLLRQNQTPSPQESPALAKCCLLDFCPNRRICCWWRKETSPVSRTAPPMAGSLGSMPWGPWGWCWWWCWWWWLYSIPVVHFHSFHFRSMYCNPTSPSLPAAIPKKWTAQTTTGRWGQSARQLGQFVSV